MAFFSQFADQDRGREGGLPDPFVPQQVVAAFEGFSSGKGDVVHPGLHTHSLEQEALTTHTRNTKEEPLCMLSHSSMSKWTGVLLHNDILKLNEKSI